jgi:solute carrier family 13 (sodium-dependent dicarboxylate transporter), member 2/3/5
MTENAINEKAAKTGHPAGGSGGPGGPGGHGGPPKRSTKNNVGLLLGLVVGVAFWFIPISGLPVEGCHWLALTLLALIWWATGALPAPITAAIYLGACVTLGLCSGKTAFGAWYQGNNAWITIAAFLIAAGVEGTGLGRRIALGICSLKFIKSYKSLIFGIAILEIILALLIPSAFARTFMILAVVEEICAANSINEHDTKILKYATFALSVPTMTTFLTAEAAINSIVASALGGITFVDWFIQIGIPSCVLVILTAILFMFVFKPNGDTTIKTEVCHESLNALGSLKKPETKMIVWLIILLAFWLCSGPFGLQLNVGTFFITALMFIPYIGVLKMPDLEKISLGTLIFVTCTVAVGNVAQETGFAGWLGSLLANIMPTAVASNAILCVLFVALICMIVHMFVGSVMATTAVMVPILVALAPSISSVSLAVILYAGFQVIGSHYLLSMHQATLATGQEKAGYSDSMVTKFGLPLTALVLVMAVIDLGWFTILGIA